MGKDVSDVSETGCEATEQEGEGDDFGDQCARDITVKSLCEDARAQQQLGSFSLFLTCTRRFTAPRARSVDGLLKLLHSTEHSFTLLLLCHIRIISSLPPLEPHTGERAAAFI